MFRWLVTGLMVMNLVAVVSCSSKKKADDESVTAVGDVSDSSEISSDALSYDPMGSDSKNIAGLSTINFEYDQATLTSEARRLLAKNADWMRANPKVTVQVEGHCDDRGSVEYNLALGERRARSVKKYLVNLGVESNRLTIISYGKEKPLQDGQSESAWAQNRRANFVPLPN